MKFSLTIYADAQVLNRQRNNVFDDIETYLDTFCKKIYDVDNIQIQQPEYQKTIRIDRPELYGQLDMFNFCYVRIQAYTEEVSEGIFSYVEEGDINILDALIKLKLASSKREAREFVNAGSCKVNGVKITSLDYVLRKEDALYNKIFFVKRGKKLYAAIKY